MGFLILQHFIASEFHVTHLILHMEYNLVGLRFSFRIHHVNQFQSAIPLQLVFQKPTNGVFLREFTYGVGFTFLKLVLAAVL